MLENIRCLSKTQIGDSIELYLSISGDIYKYASHPRGVFPVIGLVPVRSNELSNTVYCPVIGSIEEKAAFSFWEDIYDDYGCLNYLKSKNWNRISKGQKYQFGLVLSEYSKYKISAIIKAQQ